MAASKTIGGINVTISATTQKFQAGLTKARKLLIGFTSSIKSAVFSVKGFAAAMTGVAGAAGFTLLTKNAFESIDAMGKMADKLGVGTHSLYGLQMAADEAGVSQQVLERAMVKLSSTYGMAGDRALRLWIENTAKLGSSQARLAAAVEMFGMRGADMVKMLGGGVGALDEAQQAAERFGFSLSRSAVLGVERANDAFGRLKKAIQGVFTQTAVSLAPFVEVLSTKLTGFLTANNNVRSFGATMADAVVRMAKFVMDTTARIGDGLLRGAATLIELPSKLAETTAGQALGFRRNEGAIETAFNLRQAARNLTATMPSVLIDELVEAARRAALKGTIAGMAGEKTLGLGKGENILSAIKAAPALIGQLAAAGVGARDRMGLGLGELPRAARSMTPSLQLFESGSPEAYRQQARARNQSRLMRNDDKQTKLQTGMLAALNKIEKKIEPLAPANL